MIWKHATLEHHKLLIREIWGGILELIFILVSLKGMSKVFRKFLTLRTKAQKIQGLFTGKALLSPILLILYGRTGKKTIAEKKIPISNFYRRIAAMPSRP